MSETKKCWKCKQHKTSDEFSPSAWKNRGMCRLCTSAYQVEYQKRPGFMARQTVYSRRTYERKNYGLEPGERVRMIEEQEGRCANPACRRVLDEEPRSSCVDHVLDSNGNPIVRGVLCNRCNSGFGFLGDTLEAVVNSIGYFDPKLSSAVRKLAKRFGYELSESSRF